MKKIETKEVLKKVKHFFTSDFWLNYMKNKIGFDDFKKWLLKVAVISLIISILLKLATLIQNLFFHLFFEFLYDLSIGVSVATLIVFLVDDVYKRINLEKKKRLNDGEVFRFYSLLGIYIERYKLSLYFVITPKEKIDLTKLNIYRKDFVPSDMKELLTSSLWMNEGIIACNLEVFLRLELSLRNQLNDMIKFVDLSDYPALKEASIGFIRSSLIYDCQVAWKQIIEISNNQKRRRSLRSTVKGSSNKTGKPSPTLVEMITDYLSTKADKDYETKKNFKHSIFKFCFNLYDMIKEERNSLEKIEVEFGKFLEEYMKTNIKETTS